MESAGLFVLGLKRANTGVSPLLRQSTPPSVEMTVWVGAGTSDDRSEVGLNGSSGVRGLMGWQVLRLRSG